MQKTQLRWVLVLVVPWLMGASGCPNGLSEFAQKTSDEALFFTAQNYADQSDWNNAIATILLMTTGAREKRETKAALASYYAGRCGLNLLTLADSVTTGMASGSTLWPLLLTAFKSAAASNVVDCKLAETTMLTISTTLSSLTDDEAVQLAFIEFAKMGALMAAAPSLDSGGDGLIDGDIHSAGTFDACNAAHMTDAYVQELGTGLTIGMSALVSSGTSVAGAATATYTTLCTTVEALPGMTGFCSTQNPSNFTAAQILVLRALIKSNEIGFNTCSGTIGQNPAGQASDCICPTIP